MTIRAVIFDIYQTLLEVGPPPADAATQWEFLWEDTLADAARLTLPEFSEACEAIVRREHAIAQAAGVVNPEIYWPAVAREVLPELTRLTAAEGLDFLYRHARLVRTVRLEAEAAALLRKLSAHGVPLGIASNSQPYTVRELAEALRSAGLELEIFEPQLCFWSFEAGFSKPNPHVFRWLGARLAARHIAPAEALMVGDRRDNDVAPARAQGWQTWLFGETASPGHGPGGNWTQLSTYLQEQKIF